MPLRIVTHLPHRVSQRRDAKAIRELLDVAGVPHDAPLGLSLAGLLCKRTQDCRDLFALRGVRTDRVTLVVMAGRSLADDAKAARRMDAVTAGHGRALLTAMSLLIDNSLAPHLPRPTKAPAVRAETQRQAAPAPACEISQLTLRPAPGRAESAYQPELLAA